jgi:type IV pilus assembly protein PilM
MNLMGLVTTLKEIATMDVDTMFAKQRQLVGLDIGSRAIKLVQIKELKGKYILQKFGIKPLEPEVIVDGTVMDAGRVVDAIKELIQEQGVKVKNVALSVSGHAVIVKPIKLPQTPDDQMEAKVKEAAEQYIPFDINEVNIDWFILNPAETTEDGQAQMAVLLVAAKKDKVNELTEIARGAGLIPKVLDVDVFAIENMFSINYESKPEELTALVNVGASVMNVNIVKGNVSVFTRDIAVGGHRYAEALQRDLGITAEEAEAAQQGKLKEGLDATTVKGVIDGINAEVASEIARTVDYFKSIGTDAADVTKIVLCGGCAKVAGLVEQLTERMSVPVEVANPFNQVDIAQGGFDQAALAEVAPQVAVGVGLAIRMMGDR